MKNLLLYCCLCFISWGAYAQNNFTAEKQHKRILFILDASSSMTYDWDTKSRYDEARWIIHRLLDSLYAKDPEIEFSLRMIGSQSPAVRENCYDTKLLVPFNVSNANLVKQALKFSAPLGWSPINLALKVAAEEDLKNYNHNQYGIILITDGEESCGGDVCATVEKYLQQKFFFQPYIIGLDPERDLKSYYACIGDYLPLRNKADEDVIIDKILDFKIYEKPKSAQLNTARFPSANVPIIDTIFTKQKIEEAEAKRRAEEQARLEAERIAAEQKAREEAEAKRRAEEQARLDAERIAAEQKAREEAEAKRRAEEQARLEAERIAAEQKAREEAEAKRIAEEQARLEAERIAAEQKAREEAEAKRIAEEQARLDAERIAAEQKAREEAEAKRIAEEQARLEAERIAAEQKAREEAEAKRRAEEQARLDAERIAAEQKAREEAEAKRLAEEQARWEAQQKAKAEAEAKRLAEEQARKEAEEKRIALEKEAEEKRKLEEERAVEEEKRKQEEAMSRTSVEVKAESGQDLENINIKAEYKSDNKSSLLIYLKGPDGKYYHTSPTMKLYKDNPNQPIKTFKRFVDRSGKPKPIEDIEPGNYTLAFGQSVLYVGQNLRIEENKQTIVVINVQPGSISFVYGNNPQKKVSGYTAAIRKIYPDKTQSKYQKTDDRVQYSPGNYHITVNTLPEMEINVDVFVGSTSVVQLIKETGKVTLPNQLPSEVIFFHAYSSSYKPFLRISPKSGKRSFDILPGAYMIEYFINDVPKRHKFTLKSFQVLNLPLN